MSLDTACCIGGAAAGILLRDATDRWIRRLGVAALLDAFIAAAVGTLGSGSGLGAFHGVGPFSRMALVTALTLTALSAGVLPRLAEQALDQGRPRRRRSGEDHPAPAAAGRHRAGPPGALQLQAVRLNVLEAETGAALLAIVLAI